MFFHEKIAHNLLPSPGITRVDSIRILGVLVDSKLSFNDHIKSTVTNCNQSLFALRTMRQHGMPTESLQTVFKTTSLSKLLYAAPAWWGFISPSFLDHLESFLRRAKKFSYYEQSSPQVNTLCLEADINLFRRVANNPNHVLHYLLPAKRDVGYSLRQRAHDFSLPRKDNRNFLNRKLFKDIY